MDDSIISLRSWQVERQIANDKLELSMADSLLLVSEQSSGLTDSAESDDREQVIADYLIHHNIQTRKTSASVKRFMSDLFLYQCICNESKILLIFLCCSYLPILDGNYWVIIELPRMHQREGKHAQFIQAQWSE